MLRISALVVLVFSLSAFSVKKPTAVRLFPENSGQVVATLNPSDDYKVLSESGGWVMIKFKQSGKEIKGWIPSAPKSEIETKAAPQNEKPWSASSPATLDRDAERELHYRTSSDPAYSFVFPTALQLPKGTVVARGLYFLGWTFEYTPTDSTSVGLRLTVPIGIFAGSVQAKQTFSINDEFHVGVTGYFGGLTSLFTKNGNSSAWIYGTGLMTTVGNADRGITFGGYLFGGGSDDSYGHIVLADVNAHYRVTRRIKVMLDYMAPITTHRKNVAFDWSAIAYGMRIGGENLSGDVGFVIPIYDDAGNFLRYLPLGYPFIGLSVFF